MTEQEQVEIWRKDFESNFIDGRLDRFEKSGHYVNDFREALWQGFLMAKRAQKPVELPEIHSACHCGDHEEFDDMVFKSGDVTDMLDKAGIPYIVKGE